MQNLMSRILCYSMLIILTCGCAKKTSQENVRILWPTPPTQPRLEHIGNFSAETDFPRAEGRWDKFLRNLVGDFESESAIINPQDVFVEANLAYVSDSARKNIIVFDFKNCRISQLLNMEFQPDMLGMPLGITADANGNMYLIDAKQHRAIAFTPKGTSFKIIEDKDRLQYPTDIAIDKNGRLFISDNFAHKVFVYTPSGEYLFTIGGQGHAQGQFNKPGGLVFDDQNRLYVADTNNSRIQIFDSDGRFLSTIGHKGHTAYAMSKPVDVAIDSNGNLHILDQDYLALLSYSPEGHALLVTGTGVESTARLGLAKPTSLFIDNNDRIYITDKRNKRLIVWQILNTTYLEKHPITEEDIARLNTYLSQNRAETDSQEGAK